MEKYAGFIMDVVGKMSETNVNSIFISVVDKNGNIINSYYETNMFHKQHIKNALEMDIVRDHIRANAEMYSDILWGDDDGCVDE